ncbi:MAG: hypothetical protein II119_03095 [Bacilli bacterium]|nr:hypothetical protein [Bacilli bacterium]
MKKLTRLILIIVLSFITNCYADSIVLDNKISDNSEFITEVDITSVDNIDNLKYYKNVKKINIRNVVIDDISFLNDLNNLDSIVVFYSKINLSKLNNIHIKEMTFINSYIVNDNFTPLINTSIKRLDLEGSYVTSIYTLKNIVSLEELYLNSISNLRSLEPITNLPKLKKLDFGGSEELVNKKVLDYIREKNIVGTNYDVTQYMFLNRGLDTKLNEIIKSLKLDNLTDLEKIKKITTYVIDNIKYDDDCGIKSNCEYNELTFNILEKSLSGKGICYNYAHLENKLLNMVGIKSYLVSGFNKTGLGHEWVNVYLDKKWYAIDPTWIDTYVGEAKKFKTTGKSKFYMVDLEDKTWNSLHKADVLPSKIVEPEKEIIDEVIIDSNITKAQDNYYTIFIISIIIVCLFILIVIYKRVDKLSKKRRRRNVRK